MSACRKAAQLASAVTQHFQFSNAWSFENSIIKKMNADHATLTDLKSEELSLLNETYSDFRETLNLEHATGEGKTLDKAAVTNITNNINSSIRKLSKLKPEEYNTIIKNESALAGFLGNTDMSIYGPERAVALSRFMVEFNKTFADIGYSTQKFFQYLNVGDVFKSIFSDIDSSRKIDVANYFKLNQEFKPTEMRDTFVQHLKGDFEINGLKPTEGQFDRLVADIMGDSIGMFKSNWANKLLGELRSALTFAKYTAGVQPGGLMLMNSALLGTVTYVARKSFALAQTDGDLIKYLMDEKRFLFSENKSKHLDTRVETGMGDTYINRTIDMLLKKDSVMSGIVKGGWHQIWDVATDTMIKKQSISMALSKVGIYGKASEKKFLKMVQDGEISEDFVREIRANAVKFYTDYSTNSNAHIFARTKFSGGNWMLINTLQSYMFGKSAQVFTAFNNLARDIDRGKVSTWGDLVHYIFNGTDNIELMHMINSIAYAVKVSNYVNIATNDGIPDNDKDFQFALATNDYVSSMDANFFGRLMSGFMNNEKAYNTYVDDSGKKWSVDEAASVGAYGIIAQALPSILRELQVLNPFAFGTVGFFKEEGSLINKISFGMDMASSELEKISSGLGRFTLLPGLENFGQRKVPQTDDWFSTLALTIQSTNKSLNAATKLRDLDTVNKIIEKGLVNEGVALMSNLPMVKWLMKQDTALRAPLYKEWLTQVDKDPILNDMLNGRYNPSAVNSTNVSNTFKTLTSLDYTRLNLESIDSIKTAMNDYGLGDMKDKSFMLLLSKKMGDAELEESIRSKSPNLAAMNLQKVINFAEQTVPGSSRVVLSYMSNKMMDSITEKYNTTVTGQKYGKMPADVYATAQKQVVDKMFPFMYQADKESWYQLMSDRMEALHPVLFKKSPEMTTLMNTLQYLDVATFAEAKSGDVNAMYMKNVFNIAGKYAPTDLSRMALFEHAVSAIDSMEASKDTKNAMLVGIISSNLTNLTKILDNKDFVDSHKDSVTRALDLTFGKVNEINKFGSDLLIDDMKKGTSSSYGQKARYQYAASTGKSFTPSNYASGNAKVSNDLSNQMGNLYNKLPAGYMPGANKSIDFPYNPYRRFELPPTNNVNQYFSIKSAELGKAETANPVHGYVNRFAGDSAKQVATSNKFKTPKFLPISRIKIPKVNIGIRWKTFDFAFSIGLLGILEKHLTGHTVTTIMNSII